MANAAYENLKGLNEEQCVILTGESGSGKTESAKLVVDYVTKISQWRRYNGLQAPAPARCHRSTTSLGGSNRSINNSNASSRSATPSHTPSTPAASSSNVGGRRIIRARSTDNEPVAAATSSALNYGSLKKCGHERKTVEFDLSTKYKSTENLINHQVMLQAVSPTITVPKCQLHFPSSSSGSSSTTTTYHHRHHVTPGTMKKCPKHNPEAKSIMVKCEAPHFKRSTGDLHHQQKPQQPIHCRVHAAKSTTTTKVPKSASVAATTATTQSILKLTTGTTAAGCDTKESNVNLSRTMAGTPPRPRRSKTPPPTLHVMPTSSPHLLLHHRHSHHGGSAVNVAAVSSSSLNRNSVNRCGRVKTAEEVELDVIAERVHQAEQFLNAMGHATTARNANSSRFGKFFDIQIDFKGDIVGAHLTQCKYLLTWRGWWLITWRQ